MPTAPPDPGQLFQSLAGCRHVALAVSGGSDSMALLRLAAAWRDAQVPRPQLTVLTVDHGLRAEAADEARQVAAWAAALGLPQVTLTWPGQKPRTGLQAKARAARYDLMSGWCAAHGADWLLTAHTLDDQAETVLMRLARTTSLDSLAGIARVGRWRDLRLFRPLVGVRREALRDYLRSLGQAWLDDPSNDDDRFERVRVRKAMPVLAGLGIGPERLAEVAQAAATATAEEERLAADWIAVHLSENESGYCHLPMRAHLMPPPPVFERVLGKVIGRYGGGLHPERAEIGRLARWMDGRDGRRTLGGAMVIGRKGGYFICREWQRIGREPVGVGEDGTVAWDKRFKVSAPPGSRIVALAAVAGLKPLAQTPLAYLAGGQPALVPGGGGPVRAFDFDPGQAVRAEFLDLKSSLGRSQ